MAAKSLGTLTLDLVARTGGFVAGMSKAERESTKWRRKVEQNAKMVGRALGLAAAASVTALTAMVTVSIRQADESRKLAQAAGLSTEAFTALTFAAGQSGVAQTELVAATDRLNRSMLEAATGTKRQEEMFRALGIAVVDASGNLRDGDKVLSDLADRFQDMPDGAQKSALAMDLLGRSGAKLIPLLNGGSEGIAQLTRQAEALGLVISDKTAREAELFNDSLVVLRSVSRGVANEVAANLLPQLSTLAAGLADTATNSDAASIFADDLAQSIRWVAASAVGAVAAIDLLKTSVSVLASAQSAATQGVPWYRRIFPTDMAINVAKNWGDVKAAFVEGGDDVEATAQRYATLINAILSPPAADGGAAARQVTDLAAMLKQLREGSSAAADGLEQVRVTAKKIAKDKDLLALAASMQATNDEAMRIAESLKGEEQLIRESYERRRQIVIDNTAITGEARQNLLLQLEQQTNEKLEELNRGFWGDYLASLEENFSNMDTLTADMLDNLTRGFGNAFESMIFDAESLEDSIYKLASGMLRSIVNALGQMAGQWIAYQAVQLAAGQSTQAAVTATSAASGAAIAASYAPAAAMASLASFGANSAPAMAGITATASLAKGLSLVGMAHDGIDSVPQTGTWLLQKGERVTTADTSAKLDKTLSGLQSGMGGMGKNIRIVNAWDTSMIGDYMGSSAGEEVIMNAVRRNQRTIRSLAG